MYGFNRSILKSINWNELSSELMNLDNYNGHLDYHQTVLDDVNQIIPFGKKFLVNSGTAAIEMALMSLNLKPGDEVILPSYTFASCATAILRTGASPVFAEVDQNLILDLKSVEKLKTNKTRVVMVVNYAGASFNEDAYREFCDLNSLIFLQDAAQAFGTEESYNHIGSKADFCCFSFHDTKNISCGEGGLLVVNNSDYLKICETVFEKGTNRYDYSLGKVNKYSLVSQGGSFIMSNINAAVLKHSLALFGSDKMTREKSLLIYSDCFENKTHLYAFAMQNDRPNNGHFYWLMFKEKKAADSFISFCKDIGVTSSRHYVPLHSSPFAKKNNLKFDENMGITDLASFGLVRLPCYDFNIALRVSEVLEKRYNEIEKSF